jgi:hypothetical protein
MQIRSKKIRNEAKKIKDIFIYELKKYESWKNIEIQLKPLNLNYFGAKLKTLSQFYESRLSEEYFQKYVLLSPR